MDYLVHAVDTPKSKIPTKTRVWAFDMDMFIDVSYLITTTEWLLNTCKHTIK